MRIRQIKAELEEKGTLHSFTTTAGRVPEAEAEVLPLPYDDPHEPYNEDVAAQGKV